MSVYSSKEKQKTFTNGESDGVIKTEDGLSGKRESSGVCQETSSAFWSLCNGLCPLAPIQCSVRTPVFLNSYTTEEYSLGSELTLKPKHIALLVELTRKLLNYNFLVNTNSALSHTLLQLRNLTHSDKQGHMSTKPCQAVSSFLDKCILAFSLSAGLLQKVLRDGSRYLQNSYSKWTCLKFNKWWKLTHKCVSDPACDTSSVYTEHMDFHTLMLSPQQLRNRISFVNMEFGGPSAIYRAKHLEWQPVIH